MPINIASRRAGTDHCWRSASVSDSSPHAAANSHARKSATKAPGTAHNPRVQSPHRAADNGELVSKTAALTNASATAAPATDRAAIASWLPKARLVTLSLLLEGWASDYLSVGAAPAEPENQPP